MAPGGRRRRQDTARLAAAAAAPASTHRLSSGPGHSGEPLGTRSALKDTQATAAGTVRNTPDDLASPRRAQAGGRLCWPVLAAWDPSEDPGHCGIARPPRGPLVTGPGEELAVRRRSPADATPGTATSVLSRPSALLLSVRLAREPWRCPVSQLGEVEHRPGPPDERASVARASTPGPGPMALPSRPAGQTKGPSSSHRGNGGGVSGGLTCPVMPQPPRETAAAPRPHVPPHPTEQTLRKGPEKQDVSLTRSPLGPRNPSGPRSPLSP